MDSSAIAAAKNDLAILALDAPRAQRTAHVDDIVDDSPRRRGRQRHAPAVGLDFSAVLDQRMGRLTRDGEGNQIVPVKVKGHGAARRQLDAPEVGRDRAAIDDMRRHENGKPAVFGGDRALVLDGSARHAGNVKP